MHPLSQVPRQEAPVEHFDSPIRFMVKSRSQTGHSYLVDLGSDKYPDGECHCRYFVTTVGPAQLRGEHKRCYHIERAREEFCNWAIQAFKDQDKNPHDA
jgi:hypothetical protein